MGPAEGEMMKNALIISDGKPGHFNQSIALCKHMGLNHEIIEVGYRSKTQKALSYLLDRLGIYTTGLFTSDLTQREVGAKQQQRSGKPQTSTPDLIVSTGSTTYYPNKVLAKKRNLPNIAILHPRGYRPDFSHIFAPAYDHPPKRSNITELPINLCAADETFFNEEAAAFRARHVPQKPAVGIIIGGPNAVSALDREVIGRQLEQIFALTEGMERWVTTSRRTPPEVEQIIESMPFDYMLINSRDPYNPTPAFIALCDRLFVTSDSASMISECASFGSARVEILMTRQLKTPNKFEELIQGLEAQNAVHVFDGTFGTADQKVDLGALLRASMGGD
jgi:mitochondrial fission protein ELM1